MIRAFLFPLKKERKEMRLQKSRHHTNQLMIFSATQKGKGKEQKQSPFDIGREESEESQFC